MELTGSNLDLEKVKHIVYDFETVTISQDCLEQVKKSRATVQEYLDQHQIIYGINTGFGKFSDVEIEADDLDELQLNLIHSHACGVGEPFSEYVSRAMILLRANALLKGFSGVRPVIIERLIDLLNHRIHPVIPQQGSLGASGDLAPLAHLALVLLGEGEVFYKGEHVPTAIAFNQEKLDPIQLKAKEGLALINGTQAMTAVGVLAYLDAKQVLTYSEKIAAMTMEGLQSITCAFDDLIHAARGHVEQREVAERIREYLIGSKLTTKQGEKRVQDAYSIRCIPQVLGASWQTLKYVEEKLETEINAATDNPLIFSDEGKVLSGGNFHGQSIAIAMDLLKIGMAEVANMSERRIERLVNPQLNDLPPFLSPEPGLQSGAMIMQYTAASLVSENKTLAHPASVDSIPSSANQEDHVSMGTIGARHAAHIIENVRRVIAIELICAMQAVELRGGPSHMAETTSNLYQTAREIVPSIKRDRVFSKDIERLQEWLQD
ncbi:histidine ammonia-lyase [Piscibacillus halophilus]|uniref:Histidine ammonia-lyase n=1 Tax=Piscibacillus halophilus TaxID=571933 RepID=A0A1H9E047_9BACI|nr:histidine ammonia-lyase [Piscibacillus halophilus]SEQ18952.1 histidine ammonia-lyase [Piscibacillus halophilus]